MKSILAVLAVLLLGLLVYLAGPGSAPANSPSLSNPPGAPEPHAAPAASSGVAIPGDAPSDTPRRAAPEATAASTTDTSFTAGAETRLDQDPRATRIEIQVLDVVGRPAAGAEVVIRTAMGRAETADDNTAEQDGPIIVPVPPSSILLRSHRERATADAEGRAVVLVPDALRGELLKITASWGELTAVLTLNAPQKSQSVVLRLAPLGCAEVRVFDCGGLPLARAFVEVKGSGSGPDPGFTNARTDELGVATFEGLVPGDYSFRYWESRTNESHEERTTVAGGGKTVVVLRLPSDELRVVASGTVVDERGAPLAGVQVRAVVDGGVARTLTSDARGEFRLTDATGREVEFSISGMWDDEFEPATLRLPLGTRSAGFRRVRVAALLAVEIACIDGTTGQPVDARRVRANRYRAGLPDERAEFGLQAGGSGSLIFRDHADWHVEVKAHGYHPQDLPLSVAVSPAPDRRRLVFRLERTPDYVDSPGNR